jgi:HMG (high mobility group) box
VVAQNPGLANPEISKIIGEQWRALPAETKEEWKALAAVCCARQHLTCYILANIQLNNRQRKLGISSNTQTIGISRGDLDVTTMLVTDLRPVATR